MARNVAVRTAFSGRVVLNRMDQSLKIQNQDRKPRSAAPRSLHNETGVTSQFTSLSSTAAAAHARGRISRSRGQHLSAHRLTHQHLLSSSGNNACDHGRRRSVPRVSSASAAVAAAPRRRSVAVQSHRDATTGRSGRQGRRTTAATTTSVSAGAAAVDAAAGEPAVPRFAEPTPPARETTGSSQRARPQPSPRVAAAAVARGSPLAPAAPASTSQATTASARRSS